MFFSSFVYIGMRNVANKLSKNSASLNETCNVFIQKPVAFTRATTIFNDLRIIFLNGLIIY